MNDKRSLIISLVFILLILVLGSYSVYIHLSTKDNNNNIIEDSKETAKEDEENDTTIPKYPQGNIDNDLQSESEENSTNNKAEQEIEYDLDPELAYPNFEIPDEEIKTLYSYVRAGAGSYFDRCFMNYFHHPFDKKTSDELFSTILNVYAEKYQNPISNDILNKLPESDRDLMKNSSWTYITGSDVRKGLKEVFNVDGSLINFENYENFPACYIYHKEADAFFGLGCGGGDPEEYYYNKIIGYEKNNSTIEIIEVQAHLYYLSETTNHAGEKTYIANVYRKYGDENTMVYKNISMDKFEFTKNNVHLFPQIKYIFKKNQSGKFYVDAIVNLNYQDEYVSCN